MYLNVPLNSIKTTLGQDGLQLCLAITSLMFWGTSLESGNIAMDSFEVVIYFVHFLSITAIVCHEI